MAGESDLLTELRRQLEALDDEALSAAASVGLLRRARRDLALLAPTHEVVDGLVRVDLGPQRVTFDQRGLAGARCSCRARSPCQHILAACLFLAGESAGQNEAPPPQAQAPREQTLHEDLMRIDLTALRRFAGKAALRSALALVAAGDPAEITWNGTIRIRFAHPAVQLHYAGGGLEAFVADYQGVHLKRVVAAGVLSYQLAHGIPVHELASAQGLTRVVRAAVQAEGLRGTLPRRVGGALTDCVEAGLVHAAESFIERFSSLSTLAEGAHLHRLSLALARISELLDLQLERNARSDSAVLLDELARAFALATALEKTGSSAPDALIGEGRSRYEEIKTLTLVSIGAYPWRTQSGYSGLTSLFWCESLARWFTFSESRPTGTIGFRPESSYRSPGPWSGCESPAAISAHEVQLTRALANRAGRLSASAQTRATVAARAAAPDFGAAAVRRWSMLRERWRDSIAQVGLHEIAPTDRYVVLIPAKLAAQSFDAVTQELIWPVLDDTGDTLPLRLKFSQVSAHAIERLEMLSRGTLWGIVGQVETSHRGLSVEPLVVLTQQPDRWVDSVFLDNPPDLSLLASFSARLREALSSMAGSGRPAAERVRQSTASEALLDTLDQELLKAAESGTATRRSSLADIDKQLEKLEQAGFSLSSSAGGLAAARLLALRYKTRVARELLALE